MTRLSKKGDRFIKHHIRKHINELHMDQKQAIAVAFHEARDKGFKVPRQPSGKHLR